MVIPAWKGAMRTSYKSSHVCQVLSMALGHPQGWVDSCPPYAHLGLQKVPLAWSVAEVVFILCPHSVTTKRPIVFHISRNTFSANTASPVKLVQHPYGYVLLLHCPTAPSHPTSTLLCVLFLLHYTCCSVTSSIAFYRGQNQSLK